MQAHLARLQEVIEAARGSDDEVHAVVDVTQLGPLGRTAVRAPVRGEGRALSQNGAGVARVN